MKQSLRDQLLILHMQEGESPVTFYTKIRHMIDLAGYADAVKDQVAESAFINGLGHELSLTVRSSPLPLTLEQKVEYAHRYWTNRNPGKDVLQQVLPNKLRAKVLQPKTPAPSTLRSPEVTSDAMNELISKMEKMTAHIADLDRRYSERTSKPQRFYSAEYVPATGSNSTPMGMRERPRGCYLCGEEGHRQQDCELFALAKDIKNA